MDPGNIKVWYWITAKIWEAKIRILRITCLHCEAKQVVIGNVAFKCGAPTFTITQNQHQLYRSTPIMVRFILRPYYEQNQFQSRSNAIGRLGTGEEKNHKSFPPFLLQSPYIDHKWGPILTRWTTLLVRKWATTEYNFGGSRIEVHIFSYFQRTSVERFGL